MADSMVEYRINLLGRPEILQNNVPVAIKRRKCAALVYYLAAASSAVSREKIRCLLWPDSEVSASKHNLNVYLNEIKNQAPGLIVSNNSYLQLMDGIAVDVAELNAFFSKSHDSVTRARSLDACLALCRGPFLDGLELGSSPEFDDWKSAEAESYIGLYMQCLIASSDQHSLAGEYQSAIGNLQIALRIDPFQETIYRKIMLLYKQTGDHLKVRETYIKLKTVLEHEVGIAPMAETDALYNELLSEGAAPHSGSAGAAARLIENAPGPDIKAPVFPGFAHQAPYFPDVPLVDRENELRSVEAAFAARRKGLVLIEGNAGMGKTRLLGEIMSGWDGIVLSGKCRKSEQINGMYPVISSIRTLIDDAWTQKYFYLKSRMSSSVWDCLRFFIPEIDPDEKTPCASQTFSQLTEAIQSLLFVLSETQRVLLVLDDVQDASLELCEAFFHLIVNASGPRISFLATRDPDRREHPFSRCCQELSMEGLVLSVPLNRIGAAYNKVFAQYAVNGRSDALCDWLEMRSHGNPYILTEYASYIRNAVGASSEVSGRVLEKIMSSSDFPPSIKEYLNVVFMSLTQNGRKLLMAAAVYGREFTFSIVSKAAGLSDVDALDALDNLASLNIIVVAGTDRYTFQHSLIADYSYYIMMPDRRRYLHKKIAELFEANFNAPYSPDQRRFLERHYREAGSAEKAILYAAAAVPDVERIDE